MEGNCNVLATGSQPAPISGISVHSPGDGWCCATMWRGRVEFQRNAPQKAAEFPETGEDSQCKTSLPSTISRLALGAAPHFHSCLRFSSPRSLHLRIAEGDGFPSAMLYAKRRH
jgi:hypothetical protein